jgi:hypothetical protein
MTARDWASLALKIMGVYFAVNAVAHLATVVALNRPFGLEEAMPGVVYALAAVVMVWMTGLCLRLMGFQEPTDRPPDSN